MRISKYSFPIYMVLFYCFGCKPDCPVQNNIDYSKNENIFKYYDTDTSLLLKNGNTIKFWLSHNYLDNQITTYSMHSNCAGAVSKNYYTRNKTFKSSDSTLNDFQLYINTLILLRTKTRSGYFNPIQSKSINGKIYNDLYYCPLVEINAKSDTDRIYLSETYGLVGIFPANGDSLVR